MDIVTDQPIAFDSIACVYDEEFTNTQIGKLQRGRVLKFLRTSLRESMSILEINCGTGEDAVWLAQRGIKVTATDASQKMIDETNLKISRSAPGSGIAAYKISFNELKSTFSNERFDLIFSNFGGLNCVPSDELKKLAADFSSMLSENGKLVAVVMSRKCLWERFYFIVKGKFERAFLRSSKKAIEVNLNDRTISTWYYSPAEFRKIFSGEFETAKVRPVGLFIPPSYLNCFLADKKYFLSIFSALEKVFSFSFPGNYADHFYIEMKRKK